MQDLKIFAKPSSSLETKRNETMKRHPFQVDTTKTLLKATWLRSGVNTRAWEN